jgi:hypothetical protein
MKKFGQKLKILNHSERCLKLFIGLFSIAGDQKLILYAKKPAENGQFAVKIMNGHYMNQEKMRKNYLTF